MPGDCQPLSRRNSPHLLTPNSRARAATHLPPRRGRRSFDDLDRILRPEGILSPWRLRIVRPLAIDLKSLLVPTRRQRKPGSPDTFCSRLQIPPRPIVETTQNPDSIRLRSLNREIDPLLTAFLRHCISIFFILTIIYISFRNTI